MSRKEKRKRQATQKVAKKTPTLYQQGRVALQNATKSERRERRAKLRSSGRPSREDHLRKAAVTATVTATAAAIAKDTRPRAGA